MSLILDSNNAGVRRSYNALVSPQVDTYKKSKKYLGRDSLSSEEKPLNWEKLSDEYQEDISEESTRKLARELGVSEASLYNLHIGFHIHNYTTPMRDPNHKVVGIHLRPFKGQSSGHCVQDSSLGLFIAKGVTSANVQLLLEGATDAAAGLTLGYAAIGVPGAANCHQELVRFVSHKLNACPCIIFDRDETGQREAEQLAAALLEAGIPCQLLFPPDPFKDLRDWLKGGLTAEQLAKAIGEQEIRYPVNYPQGFVMLPHALCRKGIVAKIGAKAVVQLLCIASFADENGVCWPSRAELAKRMKHSISTVDRINAKLRKHGFLAWIRGRADRANEYRVNLGPCKGAKRPHRVFPALIAPSQIKHWSRKK